MVEEKKDLNLNVEGMVKALKTRLEDMATAKLEQMIISQSVEEFVKIAAHQLARVHFAKMGQGAIAVAKDVPPGKGPGGLVMP